MNKLDYFLDAMGIFAWCWILGHLVAIKILGQVTIGEDFVWILWGEIVLASVLISLMIMRIIRKPSETKE